MMGSSKRIGRALSGALVTLMTQPLGAAEVEDFELQTTADLVALCSAGGGEPLGTEAQQACFGYIAGATHFYRALVEGGDRFEPIVCPGRELTRQEVARILVDWAADHPAHLDELPVEGLVRAVIAVYPCRTDDEPSG